MEPKLDVCPSSNKHLRACLSCGLVKTSDQFFETGCENCAYLDLNDNNDAIDSCTTARFYGIVSVIDPSDSWVAKWQGNDACVPGCYALRLQGHLPSDKLDEMPPNLRLRYDRELKMSNS
ncbi:uncharacterized protein MONBRDRAFT_23363 [Monosiga brevicollis MX1]|uniref:Spt4/RpoE2 zinc finger domain-containing protein n=1 Tax=Monosiga brevicollis TaxID=81824 RepID=A9UT62_MONBE|nr:uncharacterized protein MONBRDRAFT_23363 [Monosiga brevicollis MX1]EDQ91192.1 predicted protein [Monosiga brevicollis MX1]|eukprot:XP_001743614.1 hypothetical protein [Monosiga brevicollis MX1]